MAYDHYLFFHFREKPTPDGEQVHFALSRDGLRWETVNGGRPVLWSDVGEQGVRDFAAARLADGRFVIVATDLSLSRCFAEKYHGSWEEVSRQGRRDLVIWESRDLVNWSRPRLVAFEGMDFGCMWAPDILPLAGGEYLLHWSSPLSASDITKGIWSVTTRDFQSFSQPKLMLAWPGGTVIDSATAVEDGRYYLFVKSEENPRQLLLLESDRPEGGYVEKAAFREALEGVEAGKYEAPAIYRLPDGRWCLMLDYYGKPGDAQGYVPLVADRLSDGRFRRADEDFAFPYGFKHGSVLPISREEYERILNHDFSGGDVL